MQHYLHICTNLPGIAPNPTHIYMYTYIKNGYLCTYSTYTPYMCKINHCSALYVCVCVCSSACIGATAHASCVSVCTQCARPTAARSTFILNYTQTFRTDGPRTNTDTPAASAATVATSIHFKCNSKHLHRRTTDATAAAVAGCRGRRRRRRRNTFSCTWLRQNSAHFISLERRRAHVASPHMHV